MTPSRARDLAHVLLRAPLVPQVARTLARLRGHALVLVFHRIGPPGPPGCEIVPSVTPEVFSAQLHALQQVVDLVRLDEVLAPEHGTHATAARKPRVAITFDDDLPSHTAQALPILQQRGVPATFFLSGRTLHGLGAYWFQQLEVLLAARGLTATADALGLTALTSGDLARACEEHPRYQDQIAALAAAHAPPLVLDSDGIRALVRAGMAVGFHTLRHQVLTTLSDCDLETALTEGRDELNGVAGAPVRYFAYPHGRTDARCAAAVQRAGFAAACTGHPAPVRSATPPYRVGRWEAGPLAPDDLLVRLAIRLHRTAPHQQRAS